MFYLFAMNLAARGKFGAKEPAREGHLEEDAPLLIGEDARTLSFRPLQEEGDAPRLAVEGIPARKAPPPPPALL